MDLCKGVAASQAVIDELKASDVTMQNMVCVNKNCTIDGESSSNEQTDLKFQISCAFVDGWCMGVHRDFPQPAKELYDDYLGVGY